VRLALEQKLLNSSTSFFDYGCGYGDDVRQVAQLGISASGWDPIHEPAHKPRQADVVNLGYVVNVIEDLAERSNVLRDAWSLTKKLLIVSARLTLELKNGLSHSSFADGYVTSRGTFQKFYEQHELRDWINEVLEVRSVAAAPGIFFVFQDNDLLQSFSASRYRRTTVGPQQRNSHLVFEQNRDLFEELIAFVVNRGLKSKVLVPSRRRWAV
jgi:DNA phosphorothioation-associated putative methyltransferase